MFFLFCFTFGCQQGGEVAGEPVVDDEADVQAIKDIVEEWEVAVNAADIDGAMLHKADDVVRIPPNEPASIGKDANRSSLQRLFDPFTLQEDYVVEDVNVSGNLEVVHATWSNIATPKAGGEPIKPNGHWIIVFRKQADDDQQLD